MLERIERILLYAVVLILALAVGYFAWTPQDDDRSRGPSTDAPDGDLAALEQLVKEAANRIEKLISDTNGNFETALDGVNASVAATVDGKLAGLEGRVANSVYDRLRDAGICELTERECALGAPTSPPTMSVASNFTLLYENARLNEERQVTEDSFGIRLAPRHLKRLEVLTNAFQACQQPEDPVSFRVTGYSSTAEFRVEKKTGTARLHHSDLLNLQTANLRASIVGTYLENKNFAVTPKEWKSFKDLHRPYLDDTQPGVDQQALNRTVFIEVLSAGACDLGQLSRPAR